MSVGKLAWMGVVKGLDSVEVKKLAENEGGWLMGGFRGMGGCKVSVEEWVMGGVMGRGT